MPLLQFVGLCSVPFTRWIGLDLICPSHTRNIDSMWLGVVHILNYEVVNFQCRHDKIRIFSDEWCWESLWSGSLPIKVAHAIVLLQIYSNGPVPWQPGKRRLWKEVNSLFMAVCFLHLRRMTNQGQGLYVNDLKNLSFFENPFIPILGSWWSQWGVVAACHCPAWWSDGHTTLMGDRHKVKTALWLVGSV